MNESDIISVREGKEVQEDSDGYTQVRFVFKYAFMGSVFNKL